MKGFLITRGAIIDRRKHSDGFCECCGAEKAPFYETFKLEAEFTSTGNTSDIKDGEILYYIMKKFNIKIKK